MTKKTTMLVGIFSVLLLGCLGGLILMCPMLLLFGYISSLNGLALHVRKQFDVLADLVIVEDSSQLEESHTAIIHSLSVTVPEDEVSQILYDSLIAQPARFLTVTDVMVEISTEGMAINLDVEYGLADIAVFATTITSEWKLRATPSLSASPVPNTIEVKPFSIHAQYWPSVDWIPLWMLINQEKLEHDWFALHFTTAFRLDDMTLQDHELALSIAPTP